MDVVGAAEGGAGNEARDPKVAARRKRPPRFYLEIFLISLAVILLEIAQTRIFSYKLFYYFTYLIIGLALLGLGTGGVLVALTPRLRRIDPARSVPLLCALAGLATPVAYAVVALVQLNASELTSAWQESLKLALVCAAMFGPFLLAGLAIATILSAHPSRINRLYSVDLIGAGFGCAVVVMLMRAIGPPGCVVLSGALFAAASLPLARREWPRLIPIPLATVAICLGGAVIPGALPDPVPDKAKNMAPKSLEGVEVLHSEWSAVFRVDVVHVPPGHPTQMGGELGANFLAHDGLFGSTITRWDGDLESVRIFDTNARAIPFRVLEPEPSVLVIGAAGGRELLASLHFGASEVTGVELNPVTVKLMTETFADYSGQLVQHPKVTYVNAEGRNYVEQLERDYDLIWLVAPDSYSAMNAATSGAFVLSESYLYTAEMIEASLAHLRDDGILCAQFGEVDFLQRPKRAARFVASAREALKRTGVRDFKRHFMVASNPEFPLVTGTILVKPTPFSIDEIRRFRGAVDVVDRGVAGPEATRPARPWEFRSRAIAWHTAGGLRHGTGLNPVQRVIDLGDDGLRLWLQSYSYDVSPVTDDSPFFWHFVRFRDAIAGDWGGQPPIWDPEEATGERVMLVLLAFAVIFAAIVLALPIIGARTLWRGLPAKRNAFVYFTGLGLGFMFFEVSLIQQLTLFLGYPTYSLTVTLFALLMSTGVGSLATERWSVDRDRSLLTLLGALTLLMLWYQFGLGPVVRAASGLPLALRIVLAVLFVVPLGLCLGAFMPIGLSALAKLTRDGQAYVAWAWAMNGFGSVVASVLGIMLSMAVGFRWLLLISVGIYAFAVLAMRGVPGEGRLTSLRD